MAIKYAILGLLSWRPLSGYDIKKVLSESTALYWSGNSNQVYPTLVGLHKDGLVGVRVQQQEGVPAKKVYSATASGLAELRRWVVSHPLLPQVRNTFLTQLAWAHGLGDLEVQALLDAYQEELRLKVVAEKEKVRRGPAAPSRSPREEFLWAKIVAHDIAMYESESRWLAEVREGLGEVPGAESSGTGSGREEGHHD